MILKVLPGSLSEDLVRVCFKIEPYHYCKFHENNLRINTTNYEIFLELGSFPWDDVLKSLFHVLTLERSLKHFIINCLSIHMLYHHQWLLIVK